MRDRWGMSGLGMVAAMGRRRGSRTTAGVPAEVRRLLAEGRTETVTLAEWLVVDQLALAECVFGEWGWRGMLGPLRERFAGLKVATTPKRMAVVGQLVAEHFSGGAALDGALASLAGHGSDVVRSWSGYGVCAAAGLTLGERLERLRGLAADSNMAVRETAWLAFRPRVEEDLEGALGALLAWTGDGEPGVRRFASEVTRPRGVWCRHLVRLKADPSLGEGLLEGLKSDPSKYVRDSVGNWLNDASKSRPDWVVALRGRWEEASATAETRAILKRGLRTLRSLAAAESAR